MSTSLLTTKLYVPSESPRWVLRRHLVERLDEVMTRKLALLSAPAGFGKTTLVGEWIREKNQTVAWISLDTGDNDPALFLSYLIAALQVIRPGAGQSVEALLQSPQPPPVESVVSSLINDMSTSARDFALVLDDYHVIEAQPIHAAIAFLLDHLPPPMHVIISSRADPPLPLARLRARDQMIEVRASDLRFAPEEAAAFLNRVMNLNLSDEDVTALEARTEGWAAGLQMAALSMQERHDIQSFISSFSGSHRYVLDYLTEEVLQRQTDQTQQFLLQTSILDRMCAPLCEAITGMHDSQTMLETLERANVFVIPLDDERRWYRYHQLFADLLRQRLPLVVGTAGVTIRHQEASDWYAQHGFAADAMCQAQAAGDTDRMMLLIGQNMEAMFSRSEFNTLLQWMRAVPSNRMAARPEVCFAYAWVSLMTGNPEECEACLKAIEREAETDSPSSALVELMVVRATLAMSQFDIPRALDLCQRVLPQLSEDRSLVFNSAPDLRAVVAYNLALAHELSGQLPAAFGAFTHAAQLARERQNWFIFFLAMGHMGQVQATQGHLHAAAETHSQALEQTYGETAGPVVMKALPQAGLGAILYEWNRLDEARAHWLASAELSRLGSNWESATPVAIGLSLCQRALGDCDGALSTIGELIDLLHRQKAQTALPIAQALRARFWSESGRLDEATHWAALSRLTAEDKIDVLREVEYLSLVRVWIGLGKASDAERLSSRLLEAAEQGGRWGRVIEILALQALARHALGQPGAAMLVLQRALELAEPEGYVRTFVDLGGPIRTLLTGLKSQIEKETAGMPPETRRSLLRYIDRLLDAFREIKESPPQSESKAPESAALPEPLTEREIEVLRLVVDGLTNQQIADALTVSPNTVKTHVKNIFSKLGVSNRPQAIACVGRLNLL